MATPLSRVDDGSGGLMNDLLAWLLAAAASRSIKTNGPVDGSHGALAQEGSWGSPGKMIHYQVHKVM